MPKSRGPDGTYVENTTTGDVLQVLKTAHEPLTATEIAERLDISNRTALDKLNELNESDPTVIRKQVGARAVIWFIRHGAIHEQAFESFADRLTEECNDAVERVILYGSVARGEAREDSDVDVLVVIENESVRERVRDRASSIGFDVMIEYDVVISKQIMTEDEYDAQKDSSYLTAMRQDGRVYA
ncbi:nucleotidyltransferase domain-containing protein [Halocatena pleomorpha]|uniref:nucleotidyltransferase domain-containing protein n=1 Tax=Halocatena pleomorpha TaxID=1785090 RepID=UPI001C8A85ED|nr:nucleotidyltransferase domain-containing protein [Halocatena pleomorpha]